MFISKKILSWFFVNLIIGFIVIHGLINFGFMNVLLFVIPILFIVYGTLIYFLDIYKKQKVSFFKNALIFVGSSIVAYMLLSLQYTGLMKDVEFFSLSFFILIAIWSFAFFIWYLCIFFLLKKIIFHYKA
jgi:hypothetical protein